MCNKDTGLAMVELGGICLSAVVPPLYVKGHQQKLHQASLTGVKGNLNT